MENMEVNSVIAEKSEYEDVISEAERIFQDNPFFLKLGKLIKQAKQAQQEGEIKIIKEIEDWIEDFREYESLNKLKEQFDFLYDEFKVLERLKNKRNLPKKDFYKLEKKLKSFKDYLDKFELELKSKGLGGLRLLNLELSLSGGTIIKPVKTS